MPRRPRRTAARVPEPPVPLPSGRVVHVPGRGELFYRDSGGSGPPVLLLHGWMVSADLNWFNAYEPLQGAGYRVLAVDHRGHGRGIRSPEAFRLAACATDAAALMAHLEVGPVLAVGYSMGGPIAQLLARDHPDAVRGLVLCATAQDWQEPRMKMLWRRMSGLRLILGLFPNAAWRRGLRAAGFPDTPVTTWFASELTRGSARDVSEAGRELGRYDSRGWIGRLDVPSAVVVSSRDTAVPPRKQHELARALGAATFEMAGDHGAVVAQGREFCAALLPALASVAERSETPAAVAGAAS